MAKTQNIFALILQGDSQKQPLHVAPLVTLARSAPVTCENNTFSRSTRWHTNSNVLLASQATLATPPSASRLTSCSAAMERGSAGCGDITETRCAPAAFRMKSRDRNDHTAR